MGSLFSRVQSREVLPSPTDREEEPGLVDGSEEVIRQPSFFQPFEPRILLEDLGQAALALSREPALTSDSVFRVFDRHVIQPRLPTNEELYNRIRELLELEEVLDHSSSSSSSSLRSQPYSSSLDSSMVNQCSICLMDFDEGVGVHLLPCSHIYHEKCLGEWRKHAQTCPLCRAPIK